MRKMLFLWIVILLSGQNASAKSILEFYLMQSDYYCLQNTDSSIHYNDLFFKIFSRDDDSLFYARSLVVKGENQSVLGQTDSAQFTYEEALAIYKKHNNHEGIVRTYLEIGELYYNWGKYDVAFQYFVKAYQIIKEFNIRKYAPLALNYMGKYYHSIGNFNRSLSYYQKGFSQSKRLNDTLNIVSIRNKIGKHFESIGNYPEALDHYLHSKSLLPHIHSNIEKASTYNHLGNIYHLLGEYQKSEEAHFKSLEIRQFLNYKEGIAKSYNNIGELFVEMSKLDSALYYFNESYRICTEIGYIKGRVKSIHNRGVIYNITGNDSLALYDFEKAFFLAKATSYDKGILKSLIYIARIHLINNRYNKAIARLNNALEIAAKKDVKNALKDIYLLLSKAYEGQNELKQAIVFYKLYHNINTEIVNQESNRRIFELENRFELSLQQKENEMLKHENEINELKLKRNQSLIISILAILILLFSLVVFAFMRNRHKQKVNMQLTELNNKISKQNAELDLLNRDLNYSVKQKVKLFSIIGHELRNPLWWFRNLIQMLSSKVDEIDKDMLKKSLDSMNESATHTFHLMDNLLHWSKSQLGNIKNQPVKLNVNDVIIKNIQMIQYVIDIKKLKIAFKPDKDYDVYADKNMTETIVRNILSNSMKFTPNEGEIKIDISANGSFVNIEFQDRGIGMNPSTIDKLFSNSVKLQKTGLSNETGTGLGLVLCKEFIELNKGKIKVESKVGKGTKVTVSFPRS